MKNQDDGTLSLFDDFPPASPPVAATKKPRAKRKTVTTKVEPSAQPAVEEAPTGEPEAESESGVHVETTLHLAGLVEPQRRRNSPWARLNLDALQAAPQVPHVMLVITKGEAGGAQSHVLALCQALQQRVRFTVVIGGPIEASVLGRALGALGITVCPLPDMVESLNPLKLWPAVQQLAVLINAHKPDIVHGHSAIAGVVARVAGHRTHVPVVYTVHGFGFKPEVPLVRRTAAALAERLLAPLSDTLHAQAKALNLKNIHWAGDVTDVPALLTQHEVFVLLSDHEGMPITVLEAMRAGLCVLASDLPGIREQISNNQEGLLVANTPEAVADQLLRLVREPHLRKRLGRAAQQSFESTFAAELMAERVLQVYDQCTHETAVVHQAADEARSTHSAGLVSASVRRRDALQSWALWGAWMLVPSLMAAQLLEDAGLMTYQFGETLWWCVLPYAVATQLLMRASHLPVAERSGVLWVSTTAPFVFMPLGFALLQQPYSRAAVVWAYAATTLRLWWGYHRHVKHRALRLVHIDPNVPAQLAACLTPNTLDPQAVQLIAWSPNSGAPLPACNGVVLDRHVRSTDERTRLLGELKMQHLRLYSVEAVAELTSGRKMLPTTTDSLWEIDNDPGYDRAKRWLDVITVIVLSPVWVPLAAGVAMAVRLDSKGPSLYSQSRVGRDGQVFTLWKFRSMVHGLQAPGVHFAQAEDPRITRVGRILRRTRLDELPQLFNVLMGHMSLIGPRPEQTAFVRDFAATIPSYPYRHLVRPGLTGWAQVQQGYADSVDATRIKLSYDLYYVAHYSLALDLLIAAKTVKTVCTGFGAR